MFAPILQNQPQLRMRLDNVLAEYTVLSEEHPELLKSRWVIVEISLGNGSPDYNVPMQLTVPIEELSNSWNIRAEQGQLKPLLSHLKSKNLKIPDLVYTLQAILEMHSSDDASFSGCLCIDRAERQIRLVGQGAIPLRFPVDTIGSP